MFEANSLRYVYIYYVIISQANYLLHQKKTTISLEPSSAEKQQLLAKLNYPKKTLRESNHRESYVSDNLGDKLTPLFKVPQGSLSTGGMHQDARPLL